MRSAIWGLSVLALLPFASAHGYLRSITIDGQKFQGNIPNGQESDSPIRLIDSVEPVKGASNPAINCGQNAKKAALVADANPGSTLEFDWAGGDNGNWPHNTGPMITYLASCGETTCDQFDAANAKWFKVDEAGKEDGSATWLQQNIMNGGTYSMQLPNNLAAGQYLVRHEIIGLHLATEQGGAEFYPSCSQINVGGSGTGTPSSSELVSFPGGYSDTDPGILVNAFNADAYDFPGPQIATLVGGGDDTSSDSDSGSGSNSGSSTGTRSNGTPIASGTRVAAASTDSGSDSPSETTSAAESTTTSTRKHKQCNGDGDDGSSSSSSSASTSAEATATETSSATVSTITSFAVTSTITLDDTVPTGTEAAEGTDTQTPAATATLFSVPSENALDVRPRRVSRVMRRLLA